MHGTEMYMIMRNRTTITRRNLFLGSALLPRKVRCFLMSSGEGTSRSFKNYLIYYMYVCLSAFRRSLSQSPGFLTHKNTIILDTFQPFTDSSEYRATSLNRDNPQQRIDITTLQKPSTRGGQAVRVDVSKTGTQLTL